MSRKRSLEMFLLIWNVRDSGIRDWIVRGVGGREGHDLIRDMIRPEKNIQANELRWLDKSFQNTT